MVLSNLARKCSTPISPRSCGLIGRLCGRISPRIAPTRAPAPSPSKSASDSRDALTVSQMSRTFTVPLRPQWQTMPRHAPRSFTTGSATRRYSDENAGILIGTFEGHRSLRTEMNIARTTDKRAANRCISLHRKHPRPRFRIKVRKRSAPNVAGFYAARAGDHGCATANGLEDHGRDP
jgi:hypothetical protein